MTHQYKLPTAIATSLPEMLFDLEGVLEGDTILVETPHGVVTYTVVKELPYTDRKGEGHWLTLGKFQFSTNFLETP